MASFYTQVVSRVFFPVHEKAKGHATMRVRRRLDQSEWWPRARIEMDRLDRLRRFLSDIGVHVPFFRERFRQLGFDPLRIEAVADLQALPLMTKAVIRASASELRADDAGPLRHYNTGGSSGEPLRFDIGLERVSHDVAAKWRATRWWGVDIGDPEIVIWGSPIELGAQDRVRALRDRLLRTELLSAFEMSDANLGRFVARIVARRPRMLFGYPSALTLIARHAERRGVRMDNLGIRVAFVTSERLYDDQRACIARGFGCRVANGYGGRDAGFIAHECPEGGMHISAEDIIVEIIDGDDGRPVPNGVSGEIVVTHLGTRDFPFVRYRTGDVGVLGDDVCRCGRGLPLLREIQGRTTDFVVASDGTVMHGLALIYVVRDLPGVAAFKIIQHDVKRTEVQIVTSPLAEAGLEERICRGMRARLGDDVAIAVERVAAIPPERSGKHRYVVSNVRQSLAPVVGASLSSDPGS